MLAEKEIKVWICWEVTRLKYKLSCCINPVLVCHIAPWDAMTVSTLTARTGVGTLKATRSPSLERAVTLKAESEHLSRTVLSCLLYSLGCVPVACELPEGVLSSFPCVRVQFLRKINCFTWTAENLWLQFSASIKLAFRLTLKLKPEPKFGQACFEECCRGGFLWTHLRNSKINSSTLRKAGYRLLLPGWPRAAGTIFVQVNLTHRHSVKEWGDMQQLVKDS